MRGLLRCSATESPPVAARPRQFPAWDLERGDTIRHRCGWKELTRSPHRALRGCADGTPKEGACKFPRANRTENAGRFWTHASRGCCAERRSRLGPYVMC